MRSKEDYIAQTLKGWIYQVLPGQYGYHLELWDTEGTEYRSRKAFEQYEAAVTFAESVINSADHDSNPSTQHEDGARLAQLMRQLIRVECNDFIYKEWHIKPYEDFDNNWALYAISPVIGEVKILLKRQADLQEAITQIKIQIDTVERFL